MTTPRSITRIKPLSGLQMMILPILVFLARGTNRVTLQRRARYTKKLQEHIASEKALERKLAKEAKMYANLIINCWARRGSAHFAKHAHIATDGKPPKKMKVKKVKFARIRTYEEELWFQIFVGRKFLFRYMDNLPFGVDVADLTSPEALYELSHTAMRSVKAFDQDPNRGAWIIVNRLEGVDGLPIEVQFAHILPRLAGDEADAARGPFCLGSGQNKSLYILHLADVHHILIAGGSGGGKSNMIKCILSGLMRYCTPDQVQFIMIDPKRLELGMYGEAPHLMRPVVFDVKESVDVLEEVLKEVMSRTEKLFQARCVDLTEYNEKYPERALPRIVVVVDEFAQLMLHPGKEVRPAVAARVTQIINMGRALGVHLILATQYPVVRVLPNAIKVNVGLTIAARTASKEQSKVIIGRGDAAELPRDIRGRMYCLNGADHFISQTPKVTRQDVEEAMAVAKGRAAGLIRLESAQPVINAENLVCYVADKLSGKLSANDLWDVLEPLGVPLDGLKAWLAELIRDRQVTATYRTFIVEQAGPRTWRLVETFPVSDEPVVFKMDSAKTLARFRALKQPAPMLLLPAVAGQEPTGTVIDVPARVVAEPPDEVDEEAIIDAAIRQHCIVARTAKAPAADLYAMYKAHCASICKEPVAARTFGMALKARGFQQVKGGAGKRLWAGIGILPEEADANNAHVA